MINDESRWAILIVGLATLIGGVILMFSHKWTIEAAYRREQDLRKRLFERRKFRRRSLASSMVATIGIFMTALYFTYHPATFVRLLTVILILLLAVMFLAMLDLMSVSLQTAVGDDSARQKLIDEYLTQREKLQDQSSPEE